MITVIGTATATPDGLTLVLDESLTHVARSRSEDGCIDHTVSIDQENPHLLRFVEYWRDEAALLAHFAVPASRAFIAAITPHLAEPPKMDVYRSEKIELT